MSTGGKSASAFFFSLRIAVKSKYLVNKCTHFQLFTYTKRTIYSLLLLLYTLRLRRIRLGIARMLCIFSDKKMTVFSRDFSLHNESWAVGT